jgi:hypothetical protein
MIIFIKLVIMTCITFSVFICISMTQRCYTWRFTGGRDFWFCCYSVFRFSEGSFVCFWQSIFGWLIWKEYEEVSCFLLLFMHFFIYITTNFYIHNNDAVMINMEVNRWQRLLFSLLWSAQIRWRVFCVSFVS